MIQDLDMIKKVYNQFAQKVEVTRKLLNKPLTLTEKILYAHMFGEIRRPKDFTIQFSPSGNDFQPSVLPVSFNLSDSTSFMSRFLVVTMFF